MVVVDSKTIVLVVDLWSTISSEGFVVGESSRPSCSVLQCQINTFLDNHGCFILLLQKLWQW